ncbi:MAG: PQQ-binding-like beta-propeller repeat protein [candidate division WOR-3 bacterium]
MNKKTLIVIMAGVIVAGFIGMGCPKPGAPSTPIIVSAPESTWVNATTPIRVFATAPNNKDIRYITDLGQPDNKMDTSDVTGSGDTNYIYPKWTQTGTFNFKVAAYLEEDPTKISEFSAPKSIRVLPNSPPESIKIFAPPGTAKGVETQFRATALDPENDSIQFYFDFGDGSKGWIDTRVAPGETITTTHKFNSEGTFWVKVKARDWPKRSESAPESIAIVVGAAGRVMWKFSGIVGDDSQPPIASPVVVDTLIYTYCDNGYFYCVSHNSGRKKADRGTREPEDYIFNGHPAYCRNTGHIIVGSEDAYLYALNANGLGVAWKWTPDTMTAGWGTPALNGTKIYIASDEDTLYYLEDAGSNCSFIGKYKLPAAIVGAPVIDRNGYLIFGCDNGILYKMEPNSPNVVWECTLRTNVMLSTPVIDDNGTIIVPDDSGYVNAVDEDGNKLWQTMVDPAEISGMAVGATNVFITTGSGKLFALNQLTGAIEWQHQHTTNSLVGAPLLAANGYIYFMDDDDCLYAANQSDGSLIWVADCLQQVGGRGVRTRPRKLEAAENPSLSIGPDGNIIVLGESYMYCVLGYPEGTLDNSAPWPKWQKDLYNTGKK